MDDFLTEAYTTLKGLVRSGRSDNSRIKALELVLKNRGKLTDVHHIEAGIVAIYEITKNHTMRADVTSRTLAIAEAFGISLDDETTFTAYDSLTVEINPGDIVNITGVFYVMTDKVTVTSIMIVIIV